MNTNSCYSRSDGVTYCVKPVLYGTSLAVSNSADKELFMAYENISKSLSVFYQPINIQFDDGVFVQCSSGEYYLKGISQENASAICITLFGTETKIILPLKEDIPSFLNMDLKLDYSDENANGTSYFANDVVSIGNNRLRALKLKGTEVVKLNDTQYMPGCLVAYNEHYFVTKIHNILRLWSFKDDILNCFTKELPKDIIFYLGKDKKSYLSGNIFSNANKQALNFLGINCVKDGYEITVSTLANPGLPFVLLLKCCNNDYNYKLFLNDDRQLIKYWCSDECLVGGFYDSI